MSDRRFVITAEELNDECMRRKYRELLSQTEVFPSEDNWRYIIEKRMPGLAGMLYRKYLIATMTEEKIRCDYHHSAIKNFPVYLKCIDRQEALAAVYSDAISMVDAFKNLIYECQLFDAEYITSLIDAGEIDTAVSILSAFQPEYDGDTVDAMKYLLSKLEKLPCIGSIELKKGIFKTERKYVCPDGHTNPADCEYCCTGGCGKDIRGLTKSQHDEIDKFRTRISILQEMLE